MRLDRTFLTLALAAFAALAPAPAAARTIVLSNDDGLTSNLLALYHALEDAGHDVIVSVPCTNQSGQGAAIVVSRQLGPLSAPCLNDAAQPGDPGAGLMTRAGLPEGDFHYVDGTPIMALMYGLDVAAQARWGGPPDLVLSGPNEGQNLGSVILSSGTVSNAQVAAIRGLSAIALSAGGNTEGHDLANPLSLEVARLSVELIAALDSKAGGGPLLPRGMALNVNFPNDLQGAAWRQTRIGTYNAYSMQFSPNMAETATPRVREAAQARGITLQPLPGLAFAINTAAPAPGEENDESFVNRTHITVSPMQAGYGASADSEAALEWNLAEFLDR